MEKDLDTIVGLIKKSLGLDVTYYAFDDEILMHINSILSILVQNGVGNTEALPITKQSKWEEFVDVKTGRFSGVKSYVQLRTRILFDPPATSFVLEAFKSNADEMEWRLYAEAEEKEVAKP